MKKFIVVGVLALVVIGCVLAAGCTSTTSNGNASGYMIPAEEYLGSDLVLQLGDNIDLKLIDELEYRMDSNHLTQAEFAKAFGNTTQNGIVEILGKQSYSASGTMTDVEKQKALEERLTGTKVLLGDKNINDISEWSNDDLMTAIKLRVANKDQAAYEAMKVAGTMPSDIQGKGICIVLDETKGIIVGWDYGYSGAALKEASQLSGKMTEGTTEGLMWDDVVPWLRGSEGDLSAASGAALPDSFIEEEVLVIPWLRGSEGDLSAATGAMTDIPYPNDIESIDILKDSIVHEHIWISGSEGELSAASGAMTNWNPLPVNPFPIKFRG